MCIASALVYHVVLVWGPQWSLVYLCFLYYFLVYLYFILYFSDMFHIQWFCNPLDLLNENKIQYNTIQYNTTQIGTFCEYFIETSQKKMYIFGTSQLSLPNKTDRLRSIMCSDTLEECTASIWATPAMKTQKRMK